MEEQALLDELLHVAVDQPLEALAALRQARDDSLGDVGGRTPGRVPLEQRPELVEILEIAGIVAAHDGTTIGVNPFWSDEPIWVAGPDLVASWLLTGRWPEILEAVRLEPVGQQAGRSRRFAGEA